MNLKKGYRLSLHAILLVCFFSMLFFACADDKVVDEPVEIVQTHDSLFLSATDTALIPIVEGINTFILVRHAEKSTVGTDPSLTAIGTTRAKKLRDILSVFELNRIYSTNYKRTLETAQPTATDQGLTVLNYEPLEHNELIADVMDTITDGKLLIICHSNTIANFLNALSGTSSYSDLADSEYDNLFIVQTKTAGDSDIIHLKY